MPHSDQADSGVVAYTIGQGSLEGRWTFPSLKGSVGTEHASGGKPGVLEGQYSVLIRDENGNDMYQAGQLMIERFCGSAEVFLLRWSAPNLPTYQGTGLLVGNKQLVACYQEVVTDVDTP